MQTWHRPSGRWSSRHAPTPGRSPVAWHRPSEQFLFLDLRPYVHPAAKTLRKHWTSVAFSRGRDVEPSQFAVLSPAANLPRKHWKSLAVSSGGVNELSQLA